MQVGRIASIFNVVAERAQPGLEPRLAATQRKTFTDAGRLQQSTLESNLCWKRLHFNPSLWYARRIDLVSLHERPSHAATLRAVGTCHG